MIKEGNCEICGKYFRRRYPKTRPEPKFCGLECKKENQKNLWKDPKYRQHMSDAHKGNPGYWTGKKRPDISGENSSCWKGGISKWLDKSDGYVKVEIRKGKNLIKKKEHVLLMEIDIGRELKNNEVVHHINGVKHDNRLENLQLMDRSEHLKLHWDTNWKHRREKQNGC